VYRTLQAKNKEQKNKKQKDKKIENKKIKVAKSRRYAQRRANRLKKLEERKQNIPLNISTNMSRLRCLRNYGFCVNPNQTLQNNFNNCIHTDQTCTTSLQTWPSITYVRNTQPPYVLNNYWDSTKTTV
jgi:hypothetical protein